MNRKTVEILRDKIIRGIRKSHSELIRRKIANKEELVIWQNGKIIKFVPTAAELMRSN